MVDNSNFSSKYIFFLFQLNFFNWIVYSVIQSAMKITVCSDSKFPFNNWRSSNSQSDSTSISAPVGPYRSRNRLSLSQSTFSNKVTNNLSIWVYQFTDTESNSDADLNLTHNSYAEATLIKTALIISLRLLTKSIKSGQFFPPLAKHNLGRKYFTDISD